jgi:hypothetical protein
MDQLGGVPPAAMNKVNRAMLTEGLAWEAILWPFIIDRHFILRVIRPNCTATILDSMGTGEMYAGIVAQQFAKYEAWKYWEVIVGQSAPQGNTSDCGVSCIADAAYIIARQPLPTAVNVNFWRIACWSAMGLADTGDDFAESKHFGDFHGCSHDEIAKAIECVQWGGHW